MHNACITPNIKSTDTIKTILDGTNYAKNRVWAYSTHGHHLYPKWLGGLEDGVRVRLLGYEHISVLEPRLRAHMKQALGLTNTTEKQVKRLIMDKMISQEQITDALSTFYQAEYPSVDVAELMQDLTLSMGVLK